MDAFSAALDVANIVLVLFLTGVAAYFTWRAYTLQRVATSPAGLRFLIAPLNRVPPSDAPARHVGLGVYARGPGVRYNTSLAVWGGVDARDFSDARIAWSADDGPLSCEVALEDDELNQPVYFGVVWESPSFWRRAFVGHGYRIQLTWGSDGETVKIDHFEVWKDSLSKKTKGQWKRMPSSAGSGDHTPDSTDGSSCSSATLNNQLQRTTESCKWSDYPI